MHTKKIIKLIRKGDGIVQTMSDIMNKGSEKLKDVTTELSHLMETGEFDKIEVAEAMIESLKKREEITKINI